jgi:transposase-like protein
VASPLSTRHVEELIAERGVDVEHSTINRWIIKYSPLLAEAFHRRKRPVWPVGRMEQDHRGVKRITRPMLGFKAFDAAQSTLVGIALMPMLKKRQLLVEEGNEGLTAAEQFYALAA